MNTPLLDMALHDEDLLRSTFNQFDFKLRELAENLASYREALTAVKTEALFKHAGCQSFDEYLHEIGLRHNVATALTSKITT